jgi:starch synthase
MYAQRYGSLPIVSRTGGLADTVEDGVTGFLFKEPSPTGLMGGVSRAFETFGVKPRLQAMRRAAMKRPMNWLQSARRYGELYHTQVASS